MEKDFDKWNNQKKIINLRSNNTDFFYHEREVWWCAIGVNVGFEQNGKGADFVRPVLIIKGFSKDVFICVPLTTKLKEGKYYHEISLNDGIMRKVILSQIRLIDSRRLQEKITMIDKEQFKDIKQKITQLLG
jgi:mRNA interferase MazF